MRIFSPFRRARAGVICQNWALEGAVIPAFAGMTGVPKGMRFLHRQFDRARTIFLERGQWAVFVARFVTGLRIFSGILAGMFGMPYPRFLFFNFSGAVLWSLTIGSVGFLFGGSLPTLVRIVKEFHEAVLALAVLALAIGAWVYIRRRRIERQASARSEVESKPKLP